MKDKVATRLAEIRQQGPLTRTADVLSTDVEARTVELAFSSEAEVSRWFGVEVLSHDAGAVDMSRLNNKAAVLWNHLPNDMRGVVESASIDSDRVGRAKIRLSKSADGERLLQDIADGIVTKVSVGYFVNGMRFVEDRSSTEVWLITAWQPYEISLVSIPADDTVGVGRSAEIPNEGVEPKPVQTVPAEDTIKPTEAQRKMDEDEKQKAAEAARREGGEAERTRARSIIEMGKQYGHADLAAQAVADGKSPEEFQRSLIDAMSKHANKPLEEQVREAEVGLTDKEAKQFSFMRAIRAQLPTASKADRDAAAFEFECSAAAEKAYGKQARGILIPADVLNQRTFATTSPAAGPGSNLVATELLSGSFIDLLRKKAWLMRRATTMAGLVGNVDIPRQKGATTAYWVGEGGNVTGSEPAMDQISFSAKTLGALTEITRRLMQQATPDAENIVRNDLLKSMALEIDRAGIYAEGSANMPKGLANITGINAVALATAGQPTFAELVEMETSIALEDADVGSMSYAFNAGLRGYAKTALKFPGTAASGTIWEPGNTVNGYETNVSNQIASGDAFFGNWADFIIAMWGGLDLTIDPYSLSASGGTRIVAFQDVDFNVRHVESFCYANKPAP